MRRRALAVLPVFFLAGCRQDMQDQPRYKVFAQSAFFADQQSSRPLVPGTVAQGQLYEDELFYYGRVNGQLSEVFPFPVTKELILRGQERFNIYCAPCHGRLGDGEGMIPQRGFRKPPSYHIDRLRKAPVGHFFDVITNGFGAMTDYGDRVAARDRWAIIAYIRVLQYSENVPAASLSEDVRNQLGSGDHKTGDRGNVQSVAGFAGESSR